MKEKKITRKEVNIYINYSFDFIFSKFFKLIKRALWEKKNRFTNLISFP